MSRAVPEFGSGSGSGQNPAFFTIIYKKLQAIYLMLYKRYKTAKIKKYKHEHVLAYTFNLSSVARINV